MATGVLERTYRLLPAHGRKMIEELIERVASRDVIHQGLKQYARADKNRLPPENIGITVYRSRGCRHGSPLLHNRNIRSVLVRVANAHASRNPRRMDGRSHRCRISPNKKTGRKAGRSGQTKADG